MSFMSPQPWLAGTCLCAYKRETPGITLPIAGSSIRGPCVFNILGLSKKVASVQTNVPSLAAPRDSCFGHVAGTTNSKSHYDLPYRSVINSF